jgi:type IV pilus assembly protein PilB
LRVELPAPTAPPVAAPRRRLGEILIEHGALTVRQLDDALALQKERGGRIGEILLDQGIVAPRLLLRALADQFGLEFIDLEGVRIDAELAARVPDQLARRYRALPVRRDGDVVVVAMANPGDVFAIDDIRTLLRAEVRPVMADPEQIADAISRSGQGDEQVLEAIRLAVRAAGPDENPEPQRQVSQVAVEDAPILRFVDLLIARAVQDRASDVHVEPASDGLRIRFRVDGVMHEVMQPPKVLQSGIISRIKVMADIDIAERRLPQDGRVSMTVGDRMVDLRVATIPTVHGESVVIRILRRSSDHTRLADLSLLPEQKAKFEYAFRQPWGAVFVTGPTGSGKTTSLYAALRELNEPTRNIITIEDPVEYRLDGIKQVQVNARAGLSFANALRSFLRADPDVILVGEIRDKETATIAIEASLTGHLVLSSLHTNDAASTPLRLLEMGVEPFLVTSAVRGVLAQRLARRLCDRCREPMRVPREEADLIGVPADIRDAAGGLPCFRSVGCEACGGTGYRGRFAVHEMMVMTDTLSHLVLERAQTRHIREQAIRDGMITLRGDGLQKVAAGWTSLEELFRVIG